MQRDKVTPAVQDFVKRSLKRKKGTDFIFSMNISMNFKGVRRRGTISLPRYVIFSEKHLKGYMSDFESEISRMLQQYLLREGLTSISIHGLDLEVAKLGKKVDAEKEWDWRKSQRAKEKREARARKKARSTRR